jgi:hypothetical protein
MTNVKHKFIDKLLYVYHVWRALRCRSKVPYKLPVKQSDFTVWRYTWRKNWANCAVFTFNSSGLRSLFSSRLSHRKLRSSLRESHSFLSLPADTTMASTQGTNKNWQKKLTDLIGNLCCARKHSVQFFVQFFTQLNCVLFLECMGPFTTGICVQVVTATYHIHTPMYRYSNSRPSSPNLNWTELSIM